MLKLMHGKRKLESSQVCKERKQTEKNYTPVARIEMETKDVFKRWENFYISTKNYYHLFLPLFPSWKRLQYEVWRSAVSLVLFVAIVSIYRSSESMF